VIGAIGSALSSALVSRLDPARSTQAMAIAATGASGFIAAFGTMSKPLQLGRAAASGVLAASLARHGFTGPIAGFDADPGIVRSLIGEAIHDWCHVEDAWGAPYAILQNSFKPHASCMITHPIIDAASAVHRELQRTGRSLDDVAVIECHINALAPRVAGYTAPQTGLEGKFSVAFCCVLGLLYGRATPDRFAPAIVDDTAVRAMTARVRLVVDAKIGEQQARVSLRFADGDVLSQAIDMAKGNPANPLSDTELEEKFMALAKPSFGPRTRDVAARLWAFEGVAQVADWISDLARQG
jgi:2-methylcitrate dehydratase PrpD